MTYLGKKIAAELKRLGKKYSSNILGLMLSSSSSEDLSNNLAKTETLEDILKKLAEESALVFHFLKTVSNRILDNFIQDLVRLRADNQTKKASFGRNKKEALKETLNVLKDYYHSMEEMIIFTVD